MNVGEAVERAFHDEWGQLVATLIRMTGDWDLAEECAQEAFTIALKAWRRDGVPCRPGAWLITTARNRALDRIRRQRTGEAKLREAAALQHGREPEPPDESGIPDDRLRLMFTCCHPALSLEARVALTLRTLAGLTTAEIARAFLVGEHAMSKRLTRAKQKIRQAGIPYRVPPAHLLPERLPGLLAVLYLLFNEGYSASAGDDLIRRSLSAEAIRLARLLVHLMPDEPEAVGLLALMLLHDARREARVDAAGDFVPLDEQDRSAWDSEQIAEGIALLETAPPRRPYGLQAAIAACHVAGPKSDWERIARLYDRLLEVSPTPVVELNRAVAIGMAGELERALELVDALSDRLGGYHLLHATRADLLRRLGRAHDAVAAYRAALELTATEPERRYLERRISEASTRG